MRDLVQDMFDSPEAREMLRGRLTTTEQIRRFVLAGRAYLTVRSTQTGVRFTYCVSAPHHSNPSLLYAYGNVRFVAVLTGPDNTRTYSYLGALRERQRWEFMYAAKSRVGAQALSVSAWRWFWNGVVLCERDELLGQLEVWHEGRCGRCGKRLTVPESIESGFGPDCIHMVEGAR